MQLNPFHKDFQSNPADAGMEYLDQIPDTLKPYYDPYINAGKNSLAELIKQYQMLLSNPGDKLSSIGSGFQQSPGYQFQFNQGMNAANAAAAAGGMLGTPAHQQEASSMVTGLANQEFYNYLAQALGLYQTGIRGTEGINQMGYNASDQLAQSLGANLTNQAGMAYNGQANQNQSNADMFNTLLGAGTALVGGRVGGRR